LEANLTLVGGSLFASRARSTPASQSAYATRVTPQASARREASSFAIATADKSADKRKEEKEVRNGLKKLLASPSFF